MAARQIVNALFNPNTGLSLNENSLDELDTRLDALEAIVPSQVVLVDGSNNMVGDLDMGNDKIINLADATLATDAMNRQASDARYAPLVHTHVLTDVTDVSATATEVNYMSGVTSAVQTQLDTLLPKDGSEAMTGNLAMGTNKISGLGDATTATDAMNRQASDARFAPLVHTHVLTDVTDVSATATEVNYMSGVTSAVQTQLDTLLPKDGSESMTGKLTVNYGPTTGSSIDIGDHFAVWNRNSTGSSYIMNNLYYDGAWKHKVNGDSSMIIMGLNGITAFYNNGYATADSAATLVQTFYTRDSGNKSLVSLDMNNTKITNLADPTTETDALNRRIGDGRYIYKDQDDTSTGSIHLDGALSGAGATIPDTMKIRVGDNFGILPYTNGATYLINNGYLNSGWKRIATGFSNLMIFETDGTIQFYHGGYGTAGSVITFTQRFGIEDTKLDSHVALDMFSNQINNLAAGSSSADALRYDQVIGLYLLLTGGTMSGDIAMGANKVTGLATATTNGDAMRYEDVVGVYLPLAGGTMSGDINLGSNDLTSVGSVSTGSITSGSYQGDGIFNEIFPDDDIVFVKTDGAASKLISWDSNAVHVAGQRDYSIVHDSSQNLVIRGASDASLLTINDTTITSTKPIDLSNQDITSVNDIYLDNTGLTHVYGPTNGTCYLTGQGSGGTVGISYTDGRVFLTSGQAASNAIEFNASNASGGIDMEVNSTSILSLTSSAITATQPIAMSSQKITGLAAGSTNGDALRYEQLVGVYLPLTGGTLTGALSLGVNHLTTSGVDGVDNVNLGVSTTNANVLIDATGTALNGEGCVVIKPDRYLVTDTIESQTGPITNSSTPLTLQTSGGSLLDLDSSGKISLDAASATTDAIQLNASSSGGIKLQVNSTDYIAITSSSSTISNTLVVSKIASGFKTSSSGEFYSMTENSGTGDAFSYVTSSGTGDAYVRFYTGTNWCIGTDDSDSDKLKINHSGSPSTGSTAISIDTSENVTMPVSLVVGNPSGGSIANSVNAQAVYDDGVLLTCFPLEKYFTGTVDVNAYNAKFPDVVYEEAYFEPEDVEEHLPEKEKFRTITRVREHEGIPKFLAKCDSEYNPLDVDCYWKHIEDKKHLPAMPNPDKWNDDDQASTGGYIARLIETVECQAVHIHQLNERLKMLESKINV